MTEALLRETFGGQIIIVGASVTPAREEVGV
jgi:hypothetical protein